MSDGPDFTSGACTASTTLAWGRNAGSTLFCGRGDGHEGNHHFGVEWNEPASKGLSVVCPGCQPGAGRFSGHTLIPGCRLAPGSADQGVRVRVHTHPLGEPCPPSCAHSSAEPVASAPVCDCSCHTTPGVMHVAACCSTGLTAHTNRRSER